jgi:hypothetical protein
MVRSWHAALIKTVEQAKAERHLPRDADAAQLMFEIHGLVLSLHHDARFMRTPGSVERSLKGFDRLIAYTIAPTTIPASPEPSIQSRRKST